MRMALMAMTAKVLMAEMPMVRRRWAGVKSWV